MSNFFTKAKKPGRDKFEKVEMIDNYFGSHEYGVRFPDGEVFHERECEIKKDISLIEQVEILKEETREETGSFKYDFIYDEVIELIKKL